MQHTITIRSKWSWMLKIGRIDNMATYIVKPNQNIFDVALHLYGSIEGLFDLLISNPEINMTSDISFGQELKYHDTFVLNESVVREFQKQNIVPSSSARKVYFKQPEEDLVCIVGTNSSLLYTTFKASGSGVMIVDWGDNSPLQYIELNSDIQKFEHYFDNETEKRRIRIYGNTDELKFIKLDTTGMGGALMLCKPIVVDEYSCTSRGYSLTGLSMLEGTYKVDLSKTVVKDLLPLGDMNLQEINLSDVEFMFDTVLDEYFEYIVSNYNDRRPCTVWLTTEPSEKAYAAINTILNEPEWNVSDTWKFYINNQLYKPNNG